MAKKYLDTLGNSLDDDMLTDVIPSGRGEPAARRKKSFASSVKQSLQTAVADEPRLRRKSLLDAMEEALESNIFDQIVPPAEQRRRNPAPADQLQPPVVESPFQTMITTEVLEKARGIAIAKGIRVKDVIRIALERYIDEELRGR
jgi:hypothetical protein